MKEEPLDSFSPVNTGPESFTTAPEQDQSADTFPVPEMTETQGFEFVAVKQEWVEDGVKKDDWDEAQEPENAAVEEDEIHAKTEPSEWHTPEESESGDTTVDTPRFIPQGQDLPTTDKCAAIIARSDDILLGDSNHSGSSKECDKNKSDRLLLSGQVVYSEMQDKVGTHKDTYSVTNSTSSDRFRKATSDGDCSRYRTSADCESVSPSGNDRVVELPSLPPVERDVYTCDVCREAFTDKGALRTHLQQHVLICDICHKAFRGTDGLEVHYRTHAAERPFPCEACGKAFSRSDKLRLHSLQHTGRRPYRCDTCGETFSRSDNLGQHTLRHTGECPYSCSDCGKKFSRSNNFRQHRLQHTGERPHECGVCHKRFTNASNLAQHSRVHTGERPYRCDTCGRSFARSRNLKVHRRPHTGEWLYACDDCGKAFVYGSGVQKPRLLPPSVIPKLWHCSCLMESCYIVRVS
ncbi:zinc finger protein 782-like isoform X1 [Schistocerca americana]|uniref:zinc finger protein 782-like isoform X1 n=1 Tax=Schistocerca americana TaxID=7009 RepID=UPI001F4F669A|nr:zinc finger protein 782-like isoform X1 [Schistocerca americana]XP_046984178.1 zinc finger protein 782-like isoform X1 [Schistocerca americana]XP_046984179.1 zinc finger protein 782-like isoform X1 [Schistocerca americana]XP_046984180.1 zinc finger protein 782-like isoform X1 [Schistocerca americana]